MRYNPFQPNKIVNPGMFIGRGEELRAIEQCLHQAKNGNAQHFLLQGERGIGKSSLLLFVEYVATGRIETVDRRKFSFVTASIDLGGCHTQVDIIRAVGRGMKRALADHEGAKEAAKAFWSWLTNWEVLGVRYHKDNPGVDPQDLIDDLVRQLSTFCDHVSGYVDGVLILVDEADRPGTEAGLGEFAKLLTERLTKDGCNNVLLGLAGLPPLIAKLRESHESSPRLFQTMLLEPLEPEERKEVVRTGLRSATAKNGFEVGIANDAIELIAELSEGYPHFVQQFSYSAFDHDSNNLIGTDDVIGGSYKENGAIAQLGRKYFDELYYGRIGSDDYRRVLNTMAEHSDAWVSRKDIIRESGIKDTTINNALNALKARNIIVIDEGRQGYYRLPTKSFAAWINAIKSVEERAEGEIVPLSE